MYLIALAAAAVALAPLPEGRGGPRLISLPVASEPAGALATVRYRNGHGEEGAFTCTTPCILLIPRASPFVLDVVKDGQAMVKPPMAWCYQGFSGPNLCPGAVVARLPAPRP